MKRILSVLLMLIMVFAAAWPAAAAQSTKELTFAWDYETPVPDGIEFMLFMRGDGEAYDYANPVLVAAYDAAAGLTASDTFTITGTSGAAVTKYFVLRARVGVEESGDSNEVSKVFSIPVSAPFTLTVTVKITSGQ